MSRVLVPVCDAILLAFSMLLVLLVLTEIPATGLLDAMPAVVLGWTAWLSEHLQVGGGVLAAAVAARLVFASRRPPPEAASPRVPAFDLAHVDRESPQARTQISALLESRVASPLEVPGILDDIILAAAHLGASDIHMEPRDASMHVLYRLDGLLQPAVEIPRERAQYLVNRLKIMSRLDIAHFDKPQDGRIDRPVRGRALNLRVSIFPTLHGEKAVLRLLDSETKAMKLGDFGLVDADLADLRRILHRPQGMLLLTGPTGSGKTTLLYAALREIGRESGGQRNIVTLEDPIEQVLADVNQSQVDPRRGLTFATGLRTLLRQDPNVIMLGEIRDQETANIALQAGQTGHLILSTVHANSAPAAFERLVEMGVEPLRLASVVSGIAGMRLVRRLCPHCRTKSDPAPGLYDELRVAVDRSGPCWEPAGCERCAGTGFIGRMAVFELLRLDGEAADLVLHKAGPDELERLMHRRGWATVVEDGIRKVRSGDTSLGELLRVVR